MRRRRLFITAYLVLVGAPILGLLAEVGLRLERHARDRSAAEYRLRNRNVFDARIADEAWAKSLWAERWVRYRPHARLEFDAGGDHYDIRINGLGFRGHEFTEAKTPGTLRVVCIGGSTTVQGRTNEETYPAILQARLRQRNPGRPIEVLNLGISGARSGYWLSRADELFRFQPDLVVQYEGVNDVCRRHLPAFAEDHPWQARAHGSLLLQRLWPLEPVAFDPYFARTANNLAQMAALCLRHQARYLTATFAGPDWARAEPGFQSYLDGNVREWGSPSLTLGRYLEYAALLERYNQVLAARAETGAFDLAPVARELSDPSLFVDLCHGTPAGIARLAEILEREVSRLLP